MAQIRTRFASYGDEDWENVPHAPGVNLPERIGSPGQPIRAIDQDPISQRAPSVGATNQTIPSMQRPSPQTNGGLNVMGNQNFGFVNNPDFWKYFFGSLFGAGGGNDGTGGGADYDFNLDDELAEVQKYVDELKGEAQGDYDFIMKFLDRQHKMALGNDDSARAQFFEEVANDLESRIGRIPFDYYQATDREKKDIADFLRKQEFGAQDLLGREQEFAKQQALDTAQEQRGISQQANVRGMLGSGIEKRQQGEAAQRRQTFTIDPAQRQFGLERTMRDFDTERGKLLSDRNLEDIKTGARREGQDQEFTYDSKSEAASKDLEKRLAAIRRQASQEERNVRKEYQIYGQYV